MGEVCVPAQVSECSHRLPAVRWDLGNLLAVLLTTLSGYFLCFGRSNDTHVYQGNPPQQWYSCVPWKSTAAMILMCTKEIHLCLKRVNSPDQFIVSATNGYWVFLSMAWILHRLSSGQYLTSLTHSVKVSQQTSLHTCGQLSMALPDQTQFLFNKLIMLTPQKSVSRDLHTTNPSVTTGANKRHLFVYLVRHFPVYF